MTLNWDEATYGFDVISFDWDGNEIHTGAIDPIDISRSTGVAVALTKSGAAVLLSKSGHPAAPSIGIQTAARVTNGLAVSRAPRGAAVSLTKSGHD